jgi:copper chaperone CopZ
MILGLMITLVMANGAAFAEDNTVKESKIKTSVQNWMDKSRIESAINKLDGIEDVNLNLETKILTVKYKYNVANVEDFRKLVEDMSFTAEVISTENGSDKINTSELK